jgi:hypothetical protein
MNLDRYKLITNQQQGQYEFLSEGLKGSIRKVIQFRPMKENIYNLAFGDWDESNQRINDKARSNNNDYKKILATVADSVIHFIQSKPHSIVFAQGETPAKTRLYQMAINREWAAISRLYKIKGFYMGNWELFSPVRNYDAFTLEIYQ